MLTCFTELSNGVCANDSNSPRMEHLAKSPRLHAQEISSNGMERICSHEVLQDGGFNSSNNKLKRKVIWYNYCDDAILAFIFDYASQ